MRHKPIYLTAEGKRKLEEELHHLINVRRPAVAAAIQSAKEEGDLKENSAYDEAKTEQGFVEGRVQTIQAQLLEAVVIQKDKNSEVVALGSRVTFDDDGNINMFEIVGSAESDPLNGHISNESPIGQSLMGARKGDIVEVSLPNGNVINISILDLA
ncbi:MAG: transcription elongation factor GreA [Anaerolineaceae bacterium 4572_78]|nr:MAG: transcription elongation factor GreA [Anaerolineaceae bacterium 4572_78]